MDQALPKSSTIQNTENFLIENHTQTTIEIELSVVRWGLTGGCHLPLMRGNSKMLTNSGMVNRSGNSVGDSKLLQQKILH